MQTLQCDRQSGDVAMMPEDMYAFGADDDEPPEEPDTLAARHAVLSDVMESYDLAFVFDIADPMFSSRLAEAARLLGIGLRLSVSPAEDAGHGLCRSTAVLELSYGEERCTYSSDAMGIGSDDAVLMAARGVMVSAGLLNRPESRGTVGMEICVPAE